MQHQIRSVFLQAIAATALTGAAIAGSCPEESKLTEPRELASVKSQGVAIKVREQIDLTGWREIENFRMRTRHFTIEPGGTVANHNHGDRPSMIYFVSGEIYEHNALCAVPILHKAGETAAEFGAGIRHWWSNEGTEAVVLISSDVVAFKP